STSTCRLRRNTDKLVDGRERRFLELLSLFSAENFVDRDKDLLSGRRICPVAPRGVEQRFRRQADPAPAVLFVKVAFGRRPVGLASAASRLQRCSSGPPRRQPFARGTKLRGRRAPLAAAHVPGPFGGVLRGRPRFRFCGASKFDTNGGAVARRLLPSAGTAPLRRASCGAAARCCSIMRR